MFLAIFGVIFGGNIIAFVLFYHKSFRHLKNTSQFLEYSNYSEENTYLLINIVQIFEYLEIDGNTLSNVLFNVVKLEPNDTNFLVALLDNVYLNNQLKSMIQGTNKVIPNDTEIFQIKCQTFFDDVKDSKINTIFSKYSNQNFREELIKFCLSITSLQMGNDKLLFDLISYETMKYMLRDYTVNQNVNHLYAESQFIYLLSKVIMVYKPYKSYLNNYFFEVLFQKQLSNHLVYLLSFLLANIVLQISNFILITFGILDPIKKTLINIDNVITILKCDI